MAVKRFLLDTSTLNDAAFGLDGFSPPFILDTSVLDGNGLLDGAEFLTTATGTSTLGALSATATSSVTHFASASADLGGLDASAQAKAKKSATATANLGALDASATTKVAKSAIATADLGGLVAIADATDTPPEPTPEPTPVGGRQYAAPRRKKIEPLPVVEIPVIRPKKRYAVCSASLGGINTQAQARITFSILDDDAEVLLMV